MRVKIIAYKTMMNILLRTPDVFYSALFKIAFPVYKALHTRRAYGRVVEHLEKAQLYKEHFANGEPFPLQKTTPRDVFKGIFWNALDSYRGLARFKSVEQRIVFDERLTDKRCALYVDMPAGQTRCETRVLAFLANSERQLVV